MTTRGRSRQRRTPKPIRVVLVEDSSVVRKRLQEMLAEEDDIEVVGEATGLRGAMTTIVATAPDVVVLDIMLAEGTGIELLRRMRGDASAPRFVVLTNYPELAIRATCLIAGASAFLDKSSDFSRVIGAIIANGRASARGRS